MTIQKNNGFSPVKTYLLFGFFQSKQDSAMHPNILGKNHHIMPYRD
jgi:hypothetical protein